MSGSRLEKDSFGTIEVPADRDFERVLAIRQVGNQQIHLQQANISGSQTGKIDVGGLAAQGRRNIGERA